MNFWQTFEATNMLDAIFSTVHGGTVTRLQIVGVIAIEPLPTLEWWRGVRGVTSITPHRRYCRDVFKINQNVFTWTNSLCLCFLSQAIEMKTADKGKTRQRGHKSHSYVLSTWRVLEPLTVVSPSIFELISMTTSFVYVFVCLFHKDFLFWLTHLFWRRPGRFQLKSIRSSSLLRNLLYDTKLAN